MANDCFGDGFPASCLTETGQYGFRNNCFAGSLEAALRDLQRVALADQLAGLCVDL